MAKAESFQDLALRPPKDGQELWRWLYAELRAAILDGRLRPGVRLPSSRSLAGQYGVSRGTVVAAFDQLQAEGYTRSEVSAGTFVVATTSDGVPGARRKKTAGGAVLARRATETMDGGFNLPASHSNGRAFRSYEPAIDLFPAELWARVASRVIRRAPRALYGQGDACGYLPLRRAIAEYVGRSRGVRCTPEQIVVTTGAQQALDLAARLLLDSGDVVWMEDPGYPGARGAFRATGAKIVEVPVDENGIDVSAGRVLAPKAKLAYVTPANQFPLGSVLSGARRMELLRWARSAGAWIVEDEYDAEYRYGGKPVASLQSMDDTDSVIYVGTFTKMLFNALRLGFLVLPERVVRAFVVARSYIDRHPATLDQAVLAEFMLEGHFGQHVRRMRQIYAERLAVLQEACARELQGVVALGETTAGMRTIGWFNPRNDDQEAALRARQLGLEVAPISAFVTKYKQRPGLMLGFAACTGSELQRGVGVLAHALRRQLPD